MKPSRASVQRAEKLSSPGALPVDRAMSVLLALDSVKPALFKVAGVAVRNVYTLSQRIVGSVMRCCTSVSWWDAK